MATTKIWAVKDNLERTVNYAANPEKTVDSDLKKTIQYAGDEAKTEKHCYVTGVNCNADTAFEEMKAVQERFGKTGGNVAYHAYQSFKTGEISPELCHKIGVELAKKMWGNEYQVLVATHLNTGTLQDEFCQGYFLPKLLLFFFAIRPKADVAFGTKVTSALSVILVCG